MPLQADPAKTSARNARRWILIAFVGAVVLLPISVASVVVYTGIYNVAADTPHTQGVYWLLKTMRERSVAVRAASVVVPPDLDDQRRIASGAAQYAEMCSGCHLAPGMKRTEISRGLYPRAPELRRGTNLTPGGRILGCETRH